MTTIELVALVTAIFAGIQGIQSAWIKYELKKSRCGNPECLRIVKELSGRPEVTSRERG